MDNYLVSANEIVERTKQQWMSIVLDAMDSTRIDGLARTVKLQTFTLTIENRDGDVQLYIDDTESDLVSQ